ncbi:MAG: HlyD family efflux transporter periplasmic adaptor subunit [Oscillospiraceae bacterium]|nr:HlyD family efflux transporter periplasmic adaptor subunit [Oscillospiraceae bacterium]
MENSTTILPLETEQAAEAAVIPEPQRPPMPVKRRRPGRRKRILKRILGTLIGLGIAGGMTWLTYIVFFAPTPEFPLTGRIEVWDGSDSKPADIKTTITGYGFLMPEQSETIFVPNPDRPVEGAVLQSNVWYGMPVMEGDVLVVLDSSSIDKAVEEFQKQIDTVENDISKIEDNISKVSGDIAKVHADIDKAYDAWRADNAEQLALQQSSRLHAPFSGRFERNESLPPLMLGSNISEGSYIGRLIDDSRMVLTLFFSHIYSDDIAMGQSCEVSVPSAMTTVSGLVTGIERIRRLGSDTLEVEITVVNPGVLTSGTTATASMQTADGEPILPVAAGALQSFREVELSVRASGRLALLNLRNYNEYSQDDLLLEVDFVPDTRGDETLKQTLENLENQIAGYREQISGFQDQIGDKRREILELLEDIDNEYLKMDNLIIRSPISGTVMNWVDLWPGMTLSPNNPVEINIAQMETLTMRGEIYQSDIQKVQVGMDVSVEAYVWGDWTAIPGTLTHIDRNATQQGGGAYFPVTISVDNSMGQLMEGTGANFNIVLEISVNPIVVPNDAVKPVGRNTYVFVKPPDGNAPDNAVELQEGVVPHGFFAVRVECGIQSARYIEITEGLRPEWDNWEVYTRMTTVMPSPAPSFDFDPGTDDPDLLDWYDKGYQKGLEDAANTSPEPEDPFDPWAPAAPWDPGVDIWPEGEDWTVDDGWPGDDGWTGDDGWAVDDAQIIDGGMAIIGGDSVSDGDVITVQPAPMPGGGKR